MSMMWSSLINLFVVGIVLGSVLTISSGEIDSQRIIAINSDNKEVENDEYMKQCRNQLIKMQSSSSSSSSSLTSTISMYYQCAILALKYPQSYLHRRDAATYLEYIIELDAFYYPAWTLLINVQLQSLMNSNYDNDENGNNRSEYVELLLTTALDLFPNHRHDLYRYFGHYYFHIGALSHCIDALQQSLSLVQSNSNSDIYAMDENYETKKLLATALQFTGQLHEAKVVYESALPFPIADGEIRNNYATLLGSLGLLEEQFLWLQQAIECNPQLIYAWTNLGAYYQELEMTEEALRSYSHALSIIENDSNNDKNLLSLKLRIALLMPAVYSNWTEMIQSRSRVANDLNSLVDEWTAALSGPQESLDDMNIEFIHFYIVYQGLNDRRLQENVAKAYHLIIKDLVFISPHVISLPDMTQKANHIDAISKDSKNVRMRIGFISKYFYIFEPHGMLLEGIMQTLPRSLFEVVLLPVVGKVDAPIAPTILHYVDNVVAVPLRFSAAKSLISTLHLDILVFADTLTEPITHFLAHSRLAITQVAFWGSPVTSGSLAIDYFMSGDYLEHPFRTRMPRSMEPYTEQVVLLDGQGIWYSRPVAVIDTMQMAGLTSAVQDFSPLEMKLQFGLTKDDFVFLCPQSVFKMHPFFDRVFRDILNGNSTVHVVVTSGRKENWTRIYSKRLMQELGGSESSRFKRLHIIPRVSSEKFGQLLRIADVVLHPFPFDGSRTSADALVAGLPFVTLPTEYLRGRMGAAYYRTMNIPELVARNVSHYISLALRLARDPQFYDSVYGKIVSRLYLVWEDMEYAYSWTRFFCLTQGLAVPTWERFLRSNARNVSAELELQEQRIVNRKRFDAYFGGERWLLQNGLSILEEISSPAHIPRIFSNWMLSEVQSTDYLGNYRHFSSTSTIASLEIVYKDSSFDGVINSTSMLVDTANLTTAIETEGEAQGRFGSESVTISKGLDSNIPGNYLTEHQQSTALEWDQDLPHVLNDLLWRVQQLALQEHIDEAFKLMLSVESKFRNYTLFQMEYGALQYYRGQYEASFKYCFQAAASLPTFMVAWACVGVSAVYIGDLGNAKYGLQMALSLAKGETFVRSGDGNVIPCPIRSEIFGVDIQTLEFNIINTLVNFQQYQDCSETGLNMMNIPSATAGGALLVFLSLFEWSSPRLQDLETYLAQKSFIKPGFHLREAIAILQRDYQHLLNPVSDCLKSSHPDLVDYLVNDVITGMISKSTKPLPASFGNYLVHSSNISNVNMSMRKAFKRFGIVLIQQHFFTADSVTADLISTALEANLNNPAISDIVLLNEEELNYDSFPQAWKITQIVIGRRLTFKEAFSVAGSRFSGKTVIIANADMYFDETLWRLRDFSGSRNKFLALLKWKSLPSSKQSHENTLKSGTIMINSDSSVLSNDRAKQLHLRSNSQDAWIFRSPINKTALLDLTDFYLGAPRCDNRLAYIFREFNFTVVNPAFAIHAIEVSSSTRQDTLYSIQHAVRGLGAEVFVSDSFEF